MHDNTNMSACAFSRSFKSNHSILKKYQFEISENNVMQLIIVNNKKKNTRKKSQFGRSLY